MARDAFETADVTITLEPGRSSRRRSMLYAVCALRLNVAAGRHDIRHELGADQGANERLVAIGA